MDDENKKVVDKLINLAYEIEDEMNKEKVDEEKIFKLRYQQMIQGMYLTQNPYEMIR